MAHRFSNSCVRSATEQESYWRDVGTVDAYWEANIDLTAVTPALDLYDRDWPIWTYAEITPPAKFVHDENGRRGEAISSLVSGGCIISGALLRRTLLFTGVHVHSYAQVENALILPDADIGRGARLRNVIVEKGVRIPARPGRRRGRRRRCAALQPLGKGHLPDHQADDRQAARVTPVSVLAVASEVFPLIKTGGLADVVGALPPAMEPRMSTTITLVPGYPAVLRGLVDAAPVYDLPDLFGGPARLLRGRAAGLDLLAIDAPHLYARGAVPMPIRDGRDWGDNAIRFARAGGRRRAGRARQRGGDRPGHPARA